jgi:hypothetical protein
VSGFYNNQDVLQPGKVDAGAGLHEPEVLAFLPDSTDSGQRQSLWVDLIEPGSDDLGTDFDAVVIFNVVQFEVTSPCPLKQGLNA